MSNNMSEAKTAGLLLRSANIPVKNEWIKDSYIGRDGRIYFNIQGEMYPASYNILLSALGKYPAFASTFETTPSAVSAIHVHVVGLIAYDKPEKETE